MFFHEQVSLEKRNIYTERKSVLVYNNRLWLCNLEKIEIIIFEPDFKFPLLIKNMYLF